MSKWLSKLNLLDYKKDFSYITFLFYVVTPTLLWVATSIAQLSILIIITTLYIQEKHYQYRQHLKDLEPKVDLTEELTNTVKILQEKVSKLDVQQNMNRLR